MTDAPIRLSSYRITQERRAQLDAATHDIIARFGAGTAVIAFLVLMLLMR